MVQQGSKVVSDPKALVLSQLLRHAARHVPYYRDQEWAARARRGEDVSLHDVPITPRDHVRHRTAEFEAEFVPPEEGEVSAHYTSGSTGQPMRVLSTRNQSEVNTLEGARWHALWRVRSLPSELAIKPPDPEEPTVESREASGSRNHWTVRSLEPEFVARVVEEKRPGMLTGYPSTVLGVLQNVRDLSFLRYIRTAGEIIGQELANRVKRLPHCRHIDTFASIDTGLIAVKCPSCGRYHPTDRHVIVEVLDDHDRPARAGTLGRVVLTPLFAYAMPLIRYDIGDYVAVGGPTKCRHGAVGFPRIVGRERGLFKLPGGGRLTPMIPSAAIARIGVDRFRLIQTSEVDLEFRYRAVVPGAIVSDETAQAVVDRHLARGFRVRTIPTEHFPPMLSGKYMTYECLI
jgi:phenylacetate-CoA ligase